MKALRITAFRFDASKDPRHGVRVLTECDDFVTSRRKVPLVTWTSHPSGTEAR